MPWAKPDKAAEHFGGVSIRTIYNWLDEGMPSAKIGRTRLINLEEGDRWLMENYARKSNTEQLVDDLMKGL